MVIYLKREIPTLILQPKVLQALTCCFYLLTYGDYYRNLHVGHMCPTYQILWTSEVKPILTAIINVFNHN